MKLVTKYGKMWPRNDHSLEALARHGNVRGIYVLYDGSMPIYVGKGILLKRLVGHRKSKTGRTFWDYFSWFEVKNSDLRHEVEALLLKTLPYYLRLLNRQQANFQKVRGTKLQENKPPDVVLKPNFVKIAKRSKKKR
jgi:hypothetical protein